MALGLDRELLLCVGADLDKLFKDVDMCRPFFNQIERLMDTSVFSLHICSKVM